MGYAFQDKWGQDPQVRAMRRAFAGMQAAHDALFAQAGIGWHDPLRRRFQKSALHLFERGYSLACARGLPDGASVMADFYALCLGRVLVIQGYAISDDILPADRSLRRLFAEVTP